MGTKPAVSGCLIALAIFAAFNVLWIVALVAFGYYAAAHASPEVALVAKPGAEEAALFLGPQDLAGLGLFPPQDAGDAAAAPTVDLKKRSYRLELGVPGSRLRVVQTVLFQKGTPSVNKTVADLIAKISMSAVQDKPDVDHAHFTVGKQGCRVDTWSKDGRCYFMDLWADDGAVMEQMMVFSPPSLPDHAALGAAVDAVLDRCGAYGLKHPAGPDAAKLP